MLHLQRRDNSAFPTLHIAPTRVREIQTWLWARRVCIIWCRIEHAAMPVLNMLKIQYA